MIDIYTDEKDAMIWAAHTVVWRLRVCLDWR